MLYKVTKKELKKKSMESIWKKAKKSHDGLSLPYNVEIKKIDENKFHAVFSSPTKDRDGDVIKQNFKLADFKKNPVLVDSHRYNTIEAIIGRVHKPKVKDGELQGDIEFALDNPLGLLAHRLADGGFLKGMSIGFIPIDFDDKGNIEKSLLLEISAVSVPSNPKTLIDKGFDPEEVEKVLKEKPEKKKKKAKKKKKTAKTKETKPIEPQIKPKKKKDDPEVIAKKAINRTYKKKVKSLNKLNNVAMKVIQEIEQEGISRDEKKELNKTIRKLMKTKSNDKRL